jgi:hypothetical protein
VARKAARGRKKKPASRRRRAVTQRALFKRVVFRPARGRGASATEAAAPRAAVVAVPEAILNAAGGDVTVEIAFGHAQHGTYTIQLFDPPGKHELWRETGVNTDPIPDLFILQLTPRALDQHLLQWTGAVDALVPQPGQRFSVLFDLRQGGQVVSGGHVEKTGPLDTTQPFLGILRLVTP